jgi:chromosome segregation ATPase
LTPPNTTGRTGITPHRTIAESRQSAEERVHQARRAVAELEDRHDRALERVEKIGRRQAALELELADAERERDKTESRLAATKQALDAAEQRLQVLTNAVRSIS